MFFKLGWIYYMFRFITFRKLIIYEYYPMLAAHNYRMSKSSNYKIKKSN